MLNPPISSLKYKKLNNWFNKTNNYIELVINIKKLDILY